MTTLTINLALTMIAAGAIALATSKHPNQQRRAALYRDAGKRLLTAGAVLLPAALALRTISQTL